MPLRSRVGFYWPAPKREPVLIRYQGRVERDAAPQALVSLAGLSTEVDHNSILCCAHLWGHALLHVQTVPGTC